MKAILLSGALSLLFTLIGTRYAIRVFSARGYGQLIREDGPTTHHTKHGTPTMGGVVIVLSVAVSYLVAEYSTGRSPSASALLLLGLLVGLGFVGFLDDFIKIYHQRNLGLRSYAKIIGQTVVAVVFGYLVVTQFKDVHGVRPASLHVSFLRDISAFAVPAVVAVALIWLLITGASNAVNLTDGLDGLATGVSGMVFSAYVIINIWQSNQRCTRPKADLSICYNVRDPRDLAVLAAALAGACFGFLWWNAAPAQIFMGDTGSLALGGAVAGMAVLTRTELLLALLGGLFVLQALSVILQVGYFKATKGKRLFRMAPLHHHFELLGWAEITVVIRFWLIAGIFVAAGLGLFYAGWIAS